MNPISISQALAIIPSEDSWINYGVTGVVRSIAQPRPNAQKKSWKCVLGDPTGSATINLTVWTAPNFSEGNQIEIIGKGIKRKEYQGQPEISVGQKSEIRVLGDSVHAPEQEKRAAAMETSLNGQLQQVPGPTVGMAINNAITVLTSGLEHDEIIARVIEPSFWASVHEVASDVIRVAKWLEHGKLAPTVKERALMNERAKILAATYEPKPSSPAQVRRVSDEQLKNLDPLADPGNTPF